MATDTRRQSNASNEQSVSLVGSMVVHLVLLALLAAIILPMPGGSGGGEIQGELVDTSVAEGQELAEIAADFDAAPNDQSTPDELVATTLTDLSAQSVNEAIPQIDTPLSLAASDVLGGGSLLSGVGSGGFGVGEGEGGGGLGALFASHTPGQSVVFIVDASGSMNHPYPGRARTRFGRVKLELIESIAKMTEDQRFFIMFFNDFAVPMPANRLMEATPEAKEKYLRWMTGVSAQGETHPEQALQIALQLKPEIIYFLTDGKFNPGVVNLVASWNRGRVPIHTICLDSTAGIKLLQDIARQSGATYKYVSPETEAAAARQAEENAKKPTGKQTASPASPLGLKR